MPVTRVTDKNVAGLQPLKFKFESIITLVIDSNLESIIGSPSDKDSGLRVDHWLMALALKLHRVCRGIDN